MKIFLKLLGKKEIKYFKTQKQYNNPPKKSKTNPKSLLIELPKKVKKRKFGKEIQNLDILTDQNNINFNNKKRYRNKKDLILLSNDKNENNIDNFCSKKIFKITDNSTSIPIGDNNKKI